MSTSIEPRYARLIIATMLRELANFTEAGNDTHVYASAILARYDNMRRYIEAYSLNGFKVVPPNE